MDLLSLGVILPEMATGSRPFRGDSMAALMSAILRDPAPLVERARGSARGRPGNARARQPDAPMMTIRGGLAVDETGAIFPLPNEK